MNDTQDAITILVIKRDETPILKTIPNTLEAKQAEVGGYLEPLTLKDGATLYCNEEGKIGRWKLNRAILSDDLAYGEDGRIVKMMAGTFIIVGFDTSTGMDVSLTKKQSDYWGWRFRMRDVIRKANGRSVVMQVPID